MSRYTFPEVPVPGESNFGVTYEDALQGLVDIVSDMATRMEGFEMLAIVASQGLTYVWLNDTQRTMEQGMVDGQLGFQQNTGWVFKYAGEAWVPFYHMGEKGEKGDPGQNVDYIWETVIEMNAQAGMITGEQGLLKENMSVYKYDDPDWLFFYNITPKPEGLKYFWADQAEREAQEDMLLGNRGYQQDSGNVYEYDGADWIFKYDAGGEGGGGMAYVWANEAAMAAQEDMTEQEEGYLQNRFEVMVYSGGEWIHKRWNFPVMSGIKPANSRALWMKTGGNAYSQNTSGYVINGGNANSH